MQITSVRDPIEWRMVEPNIKYNAKWHLVPKVITAVNTNNTVEIFKQKKYDITLLNQLNTEIGKQFVRANHQIEFDNTLPYSEERQKLFRGTLPDEMFVPIFERQIPESELVATVPVEYDYPNAYVATVLNNVY